MAYGQVRYETVATVDDNGLVTSLSPGTTTINYAVTQYMPAPTTVSALVTVNTVPAVENQ
ncbi:MAG: Ig-like domain-containing protein [Bacteroidota bacterium]